MIDVGTGGQRDGQSPSASLVFGYGPMLPLPVAALIAWIAPPPWPMVMTWLAIWWAAAILIFLAGVRRGLSFGGEAVHTRDLAVMLWLFVLGAAALAVPTPLESLALLVLGYASVAIVDPVAAYRGMAPLHFARLRPWQAAIAILGLGGLLIYRIASVAVV